MTCEDALSRGLTSEKGRGKLSREEVIGHANDLERERPQAADDEKRSAARFISLGGPGPVQPTDCKEDHADKGLARVDDGPATELVGRERPEQDGEKIAAPFKGALMTYS